MKGLYNICLSFAVETEVWEEDLDDDIEMFAGTSAVQPSSLSRSHGSSLVFWLIYFIALMHYILDAAISLLLKVLAIFFLGPCSNSS